MPSGKKDQLVFPLRKKDQLVLPLGKEEQLVLPLGKENQSVLHLGKEDQSIMTHRMCKLLTGALLPRLTSLILVTLWNVGFINLFNKTKYTNLILCFCKSGKR